MFLKWKTKNIYGFNDLLSNCVLKGRKVSYDYSLPFSHFVNFDTYRKKFPNHSKKIIEKAIAQAYYTLDVIKDNRSVVEIFGIHPDKIYEISKTNDFRNYVYFEDFVRENKVEVKISKRMIEILKNKDELTLEAAYKKSKEETQQNKKLNQGNETEIKT